MEFDSFMGNGTRSLLNSAEATRPSVDFSKQVILAIWLGRKPTVGYQLGLKKDMAEVKNNRATIQIEMREPEKDAVLAQILTNPCLLLKLPKGGYDTIEVISQTRDSLAILSIEK